MNNDYNELGLGATIQREFNKKFLVCVSLFDYYTFYAGLHQPTIV